MTRCPVCHATGFADAAAVRAHVSGTHGPRWNAAVAQYAPGWPRLRSAAREARRQRRAIAARRLQAASA
jgi:hypothetical protein